MQRGKVRSAVLKKKRGKIQMEINEDFRNNMENENNDKEKEEKEKNGKE